MCTCCTKHDGSLAVCGPLRAAGCLPPDTRRSQRPCSCACRSSTAVQHVLLLQRLSTPHNGPQLAGTLEPSARPDCVIDAPWQRIASESVLRELQKHPEAWTRVDRILELSQSQQAKFIALQVHKRLQSS